MDLLQSQIPLTDDVGQSHLLLTGSRLQIKFCAELQWLSTVHPILEYESRFPHFDAEASQN